MCAGDVCSCIREGQRTTSHVIFQDVGHLLCDRVFHWHGGHQLGWTGWPASSMDSPCLHLPSAGFGSTQLHGWVFTGVPTIGLSSPCFQGKHSTSWADVIGPELFIFKLSFQDFYGTPCRSQGGGGCCPLLSCLGACGLSLLTAASHTQKASQVWVVS